jgi:DNA-directed RNA polymerase beta' subunit
MNMHVPQSTQAQMELKYLAAVQHHFISPSSNSPIISPSQDNLLGVYKITADGVELTQTEATHLLSGTEAFNGILPEPELKEGKRVRWTGKQIYSVILPPITLNIGKLNIKNGIVKSGQVSKKESAGIMQAIHSEFGAAETARYINDLQYITSRFLIKTGFSVGVSDMLLHPDLQKKNHDRIVKVFEDEVELMRKVHLNILDDKGTGDYASVFEGEARKLLKSADDEIMKKTSETLSPENNRVKFMVSSGAKGKAFNIKQMMCLLGQQDIEGSRVPLGFTDRTLPHYPRYENGLESRGFITGNFIEGLNPQEYFFHAIAGRIGLIDTAVKTAKSGYLQRRLVKMMEDLRACHDNSVRDGNNNIIEFCYGADGFDGMKLESQTTHFKLIESETLMNDYIITEEDGNTMKDYVLARVVTKMKKDNPNWFSKCQEYNKMVQKSLDLLHVEMTKLNNGNVVDSLKFPANIPKLIAKAKNIYGLEDCKVKSNMHFLDVIERLEQCMDDCMVNGDRNNVLMILLCDHLSPKKVLRDYNFNKDALEYVCSQIYLGFQRGLVNPGEMVGPVAAQSIGEQSTQMTLNSVVFDTEIELYKNENTENTENTENNENSNTTIVKIGEYIDNLLEKNKSKIKYISENRTQYLELEKPVYIDSCDMDGNVKKCKVTAVTKHLPVGDLVKIKTNSGRSVIATQQKSFLVYNPSIKKLEVTEGINLKIGDLIPVKDFETCNFNDILCYQPIINIEYIKPEEGQYVYDLTVPETLNFGLANGIMMRDTFHSAGTGASVTAGVPRMEEILSVTSNPKNPSNILYLKPDSMFNKDKAEVIKNSISQITIGEILKNDPEFYLEPTNKIENVLEEDRAFMKFYEVFTEMEDGTKDIKNNPWVIRLEFDRKEMINHNISMSDIHLIMSMQSEYSDAVLMYSDDNSGKLVFRIKMPFESKQEVEDDIKLLKGKVEEIKGVIIKGVDNINKAFVNNIDDPEDNNNYYHIKDKKSYGLSKPGDTYVSKKEYVISTEGSNLFELLIRDDIDETRSYSIEPNEMWSIFGIEACKFVIQQQFFKVFADSGAFTNPRHICLLVNKMCHDGEPHAISIYGVAKEDIGPLAKASFERPVEFFKNAALFGEIDELKGVSANIMMGQIANAGTGCVRCYLDEEALAEGLKRKGLTKASTEDTMTEAELLKQFEQRICVSEEDKIKINMTDVKEDGVNLDMIPTVQVE